MVGEMVEDESIPLGTMYEYPLVKVHFQALRTIDGTAVNAEMDAVVDFSRTDNITAELKQLVSGFRSYVKSMRLDPRGAAGKTGTPAQQ